MNQSSLQKFAAQKTNRRYNMKQLFKRDFTMVVIGQIISLFGNAILRFALPLYLLRKTDSSSLFGAVTAAHLSQW